MTGQMSLFDSWAEEDKKSFEIRMPDVGEYEKEKQSWHLKNEDAWRVHKNLSPH